MIHPISLVTSDSLDGFIAPVVAHEPAPCGLTLFGRKLGSPCLQRFASTKGFLLALCLLTLLQGAAQGYLATTLKVIAQRFGLGARFVDWIQVGSEATQGLVALGIAHWGSRGHRPSWLAFCVFLHASTCVIVSVPLIFHGSKHNATTPNNTGWLCSGEDVPEEPPSDTCWSMTIVLIAVQIGAGISATSLVTHGLSYLDDNTERSDSPTFLGVVLGVRQLGPKLGQILAYNFSSLSGATAGSLVKGAQLDGLWWLGWPVLSALMMFIALLVAMFPQEMPSVTLKAIANSILDMATRHVNISEQREVIGKPPNTKLCPTVKRLLTNKMVVCNTLGMVLMCAALENFQSLENRYLESVYFIPMPENVDGVFQDRWISRVTTGFMKPPLVAMAVLLSGLIISRSTPRPTVLAGWNVFLALAAAAVFFSYISLDCHLPLSGKHGDSLHLNSCNRDCKCSLSTPFLPVCSGDGEDTFYSPCHAGCKTVDNYFDIQMFKNCSCTKYSGGTAKRGPCNDDKCTGNWVTFQTLGVMVATLLGTGLVGNLLLCLRCVLPQDKATMLGFELMLVGKTTVPAKLAYKLVADSTCKYWGDSTYTCKLFNAHDLALYINVMTGSLLLLSALFGIFVWRFSRNLRLYTDDDVVDLGIQMSDLQRQKLSKRMATPAVRRRKKDIGSTQAANNGGESSDSAEEGERQALMEGGAPTDQRRPANGHASSEGLRSVLV